MTLPISQYDAIIISLKQKRLTTALQTLNDFTSTDHPPPASITRMIMDLLLNDNPTGVEWTKTIFMYRKFVSLHTPGIFKNVWKPTKDSMFPFWDLIESLMKEIQDNNRNVTHKIHLQNFVEFLVDVIDEDITKYRGELFEQLSTVDGRWSTSLNVPVKIIQETTNPSNINLAAKWITAIAKLRFLDFLSTDQLNDKFTDIMKSISYNDNLCLLRLIDKDYRLILTDFILCSYCLYPTNAKNLISLPPSIKKFESLHILGDMLDYKKESGKKSQKVTESIKSISFLLGLLVIYSDSVVKESGENNREVKENFVDIENRLEKLDPETNDFIAWANLSNLLDDSLDKPFEIKGEKPSEFTNLTFNSDVPFLRTSSNSDIFTSIDQSGSDSQLLPLDWTKFGESEVNLDSHSQTLMSSNSTNVMTSGDAKTCWPFVFESHYKDSSKDYSNAIDPSQLESKESHQLTLPIDNGTLSGASPYYSNNFPVMSKANSALEAVKMLGATTFSSSFVERLIDESENERNMKSEIYTNYLPPEQPQLQLHTALTANQKTIDPSIYTGWNPAQHWGLSHPQNICPSLTSSNTIKAVETSISGSKRGKVSTLDPAGNRRKTMQHSIVCTECNFELGIAFIRGAPCGENDNGPISAVCQNCSAKSPHVHYENINDQRKRKRRESKTIDCEVCHSKIGNGGLSGHLSAPEVKVEFVCGDCGVKYMFCSECGGGGKQRTGKWRPRELFEQGRRTCSLPHIRVGTAELHYKVIRASELTSDILQGIQDVFFDCLLSLYCVPSVMSSNRYNSFETIKREIERLWVTSVLDVLTNNVLNGRKYVTVAWIHKRHRNKGIGRSNPTKEMIPWLKRLGLSGIISPSKFASGQDSEEKHHCFVAFSIAEWDPVNQSIFMAQMAPRSVFLKTMEGYIELIRNCIQQIQKDAIDSHQDLPEHIWCWTKADHARLQSIPTRLKFVPKADYLESRPDLDANALERHDYEPLHAEGTAVYAAPTKTFISSKD
ncbi:hypothetical protein HDV06_003076 [Boothiomyces sp. JEL0866]|nr:hypothetical protein HDV06_000520 [Boothiomyces sp. JEL0866]KAJ3322356.1 hypothetical protein HDV06_003076 [Boothiomyces sp. JEL0866]